MKTCKVISIFYLLLSTSLCGCQIESLNARGIQSSVPAPQGLENVTSVQLASITSAPAKTLSMALSKDSKSKAIQTRSGPEGLEVDLVRAGITGKIFTVELLYRNPNSEYISNVEMPIQQVSYIDDATAKRYGVLKDESGQYLASPLGKRDKTIVDLGGFSSVKKSKVAWFKFPAPPAGTKTVSINIPDVGPYDGISVRP
ncbi:MAG: hypothetical protein N4J56_003821 [Chroococcidiopsis sp. SAG 2025]|nr:hypothetical protein [Chroococcidiopsis sp. SAG 2025]